MPDDPKPKPTRIGQVGHKLSAEIKEKITRYALEREARKRTQRELQTAANLSDARLGTTHDRVLKKLEALAIAGNISAIIHVLERWEDAESKKLTDRDRHWIQCGRELDALSDAELERRTAEYIATCSRKPPAFPPTVTVFTDADIIPPEPVENQVGSALPTTNLYPSDAPEREPESTEQKEHQEHQGTTANCRKLATSTTRQLPNQLPATYTAPCAPHTPTAKTLPPAPDDPGPRAWWSPLSNLWALIQDRTK